MAKFLVLLCAASVYFSSTEALSASDVLNDGVRAGKYYLDHTTEKYACGWERGTYMLGLIELYKATNEETFKDFASGWADNFKWKLCGEKQSPDDPQGIADANNQLCGATYVELYNLDGKKNATMIEATRSEFDAEIADPKSSNYWSWVDTFFMAMNTFSRLGKATGEQKYLDKMWLNFNASALSGPDQKTTFHFWSDEYHLFYRDDRFLNTNVFWGRGNSWAMGGLVSAIENSPMTDPHRAIYVDLFQKQSAALMKIQGDDGCWRASLLNATGYPTAETTGSSGFTFGMAYGVNNNLLDSATYLPVVKKAWGCLSQKALQPSGLFGYCQPVGGSPEHNILPNSTSDFCVGLFMLATTEVAKLPM